MNCRRTAIRKKAKRKSRIPAGAFVLSCCFACGIISIGWEEFFVGSGVVPIGTLAQLLGVAVVPFLVDRFWQR
jgi:hypothetical protein